jgi:hypothetical protein
MPPRVTEHQVPFPPVVTRALPPVRDLPVRPFSDHDWPAPITLVTTPDWTGNWWREMRGVYVRRNRTWSYATWDEWRDVVHEAARGNLGPLAVLPPVDTRPRTSFVVGPDFVPPHNFRVDEGPDDVLYKVLDHLGFSDWVAPVDWRLENDEVRRRDLRARHLDEELRIKELRSERLCPPTDQIGWLYVVASTTGPLKVGWALNVKHRVAELREEYGERMYLVDVETGTKNDERKVHEALNRWRLPRAAGLGIEWFLDVLSVREALRNLDVYLTLDARLMRRLRPVRATLTAPRPIPRAISKPKKNPSARTARAEPTVRRGTLRKREP